MNEWNLRLIISHFNDVIKDIDFQNLPPKDSTEYRTLVLDTANKQLFSDGRYTVATEWALEIFRVEKANALLYDLAEVQTLTDAERLRLGFYRDLKEVCFPLFNGQEVDWTSWPWNMEDGSSSLDNQQLFQFVTDCQWPGLSAAILYDLYQQVWKQDQFYSTVARQQALEGYDYDLKPRWEKGFDTEEKRNELSAMICHCMDDLWSMENHMKIGRMLGFDGLTQSIYDAIDTFICPTYDNRQVKVAQQLAKWIKKHRLVDNRHPRQKTLDNLHSLMTDLMNQYHVCSPDQNFTWMILIYDILGLPLTKEEEQEWEEDSENWE